MGELDSKELNVNIVKHLRKIFKDIQSIMRKVGSSFGTMHIAVTVRFRLCNITYDFQPINCTYDHRNNRGKIGSRNRSRGLSGKAMAPR